MNKPIMVTVTDIQSLSSKEFAAVEPACIRRHIHLATSVLSAKRWGAIYNAGLLNLAAHTLTLELLGRTAPSGPVASESAGPLSHSYAVAASDDGLDMTPYGRMFKTLRASLVRNPLVI